MSSTGPSATAKVQLARELIKQKQWAQALDQLNDALMAESKHVEGFILRSRVFYVLGQAENAVTDAERAIRLDEQNPAATLQLAHLLLAEGQFEQALAAAQEGLSNSPGNLALRHLCAVVHFATNDFGSALRDAANLLQDGEVDAEQVNSAASIFASSLEALRLRDEDNVLQSEHLAYPDGVSPGQLPPELEGVSTSKVAGKLVEIGQKYFEKGSAADFDHARRVWEACRLIYSVTNQVEEASHVANKLAQVYMSLGRPDRARATLASKQKRQVEDTHEADVERSNGNFSEAVTKYQEVLQKLTKLDFTNQARVRLKLGAVYFELANVAAAKTTLREAADNAAQAGDTGSKLELEALNELAKCYLSQGELRDAQRALVRAKELHTTAYKVNGIANADAEKRREFLGLVRTTHATIGELCLKMNEPGKAFEWFERARSFELSDELAMAVARDDLADVVLTEVDRAMTLSGADVVLSFYNITPSRLHGFLVSRTPGAKDAAATCTYKAVSFPSHLALAPDVVCTELRNEHNFAQMMRGAGAGADPGLGPSAFGQMLDSQVDGAASASGVEQGQQQTNLAASASVLGPRRSLRFRASTKAVEADMEAAERRATAAEVEARKRQDAVPEDRRNVTHNQFVALIAPFMPTIEKLAKKKNPKGSKDKHKKPLRCVVSCEDALFTVPWNALWDPHTDKPLADFLRVTAVTTCIAQFNRACTKRETRLALFPRTDGDFASDVDFKAVAVVDDSIARSAQEVRDLRAACKAVDVVCANDTPLTRDELQSHLRDVGAVHVAMRYSNAPVAPQRETETVPAPKDEREHADYLEVKPKADGNVKGVVAHHVVTDNDPRFASGTSGWLYAAKTKEPPAKLTVQVMSYERSVDVTEVCGRFAFPPSGNETGSAVITLDLEGGAQDVAVAHGNLTRGFLAAGAAAVVLPQWMPSSPKTASEQHATRVFYNVFYAELRKAGNVFDAFEAAQNALRKAEAPFVWSAFALYL